jgi:hypothetical protein
VTSQEIGKLINEAGKLYDFDIYGDNPYEVRWDQLGLRAKLDRFEYEKKQLFGFCRITPIEGGVRDRGSQLSWARGRINLSSFSSRSSFMSDLKKKDDSLEWKDMMEQATENIESRYRSGVPEVQLHGADPEEAEEKWVVKPILEKESITVIYADGSSAKSYFAQYLSVLLSEGISANGLNTDGLQVPVYYMDWETTESELNQRLGKIRRGLGVAAESSGNFWYKRMFLPVSDEIETLRDSFAKHNIQVCIVDSLAAASSGQLESAEAITNAFNALRALKGVSFLIISHVNRSNEMFGSRYTWNNSRNVIRVKKEQDEDSPELTMGLWSEKSNNDKKFRPMTFVIDFDIPHVVRVKRVAVKDSILADQLSVFEQIRNALSSGVKTKEELAEELGKEEGHIGKELSNHRYDERKNPLGAFVRLGKAREKDVKWGNKAESNVVRSE